MHFHPLMDRWKGRVALVTGASVGIGAATAKELVRFGMKVVGCARDVEKIKVCFKYNFIVTLFSSNHLT
uniref:Dehydrogenase/reductase SDR family member 11 n=1 Tax=Poecilia latipinna TaxID=48699 RepID=A0A3B3UHW4_9TELE